MLPRTAGRDSSSSTWRTQRGNPIQENIYITKKTLGGGEIMYIAGATWKRGEGEEKGMENKGKTCH